MYMSDVFSRTRKKVGSPNQCKKSTQNNGYAPLLSTRSPPGAGLLCACGSASVVFMFSLEA